MNYLARLKAMQSEAAAGAVSPNTPLTLTAKTDRSPLSPPFDSFVSAPLAHIGETSSHDAIPSPPVLAPNPAGAVPPGNSTKLNIAAASIEGAEGIPPHVTAGLARLEAMPTPMLVNPKVWPLIVDDARRLIIQLWAGEALARGWHPLDLWGCWPGSDDDAADHRRDGLAVWLDGRRIVALDERVAIIRHGDRFMFYTRPRDYGERVFLWQIKSNRWEKGK